MINGRFLAQRTTGVQRYAREILAAMSRILASDPRRAEALSFRLGLPSDAMDDVPDFLDFADRIPGRRRGYAWEQFEHRRAGGLSLNLCNVAPILGRRKIVCIHDVNTILAPYSYDWKYRTFQRLSMPLLGRTAAAVVTVSRASAEALSRFGIVPGADRVEVIPNGHEHVFAWRPEAARLDPAAITDRPFVVMLGSAAPHKNLALVRTIAPVLAENGIDCVVTGHLGGVFAGGGDRGGAGIRQVGFVDDDDIALLLGKAVCLLFPSHVEGFGLPIIEAMALGCPVVAADCSSMPEVCADAALLRPPGDPGAWIDAVERLTADPGLRDRYRHAGHLRAKSYSWSASAEKYLALIEKLCIPAAA